MQQRLAVVWRYQVVLAVLVVTCHCAAARVPMALTATSTFSLGRVQMHEEVTSICRLRLAAKFRSRVALLWVVVEEESH